MTSDTGHIDYRLPQGPVVCKEQSQDHGDRPYYSSGFAAALVPLGLLRSRAAG